VHTFEFHAGRQKQAAEELCAHGLSGIVHSSHRDVEAEGFPEELEGAADAVILDLPGPWKVRETLLFLSFVAV
jgi:tRNA (adenine57-N1/adenine58-N1)-methyltransferase